MMYAYYVMIVYNSVMSRYIITCCGLYVYVLISDRVVSKQF
jgi:hypothetical protein